MPQTAQNVLPPARYVIMQMSI